MRNREDASTVQHRCGKLKGDAGSDASKLEDCTEREMRASTNTHHKNRDLICNSSTEQQQKKKKKARWTKEQKRLRQRQPRKPQQGAHAGCANVAALTSLIAGAPTVLKRPWQWSGPVFCNPFVEVARAVSVLPTTPCAAATNQATGVGLNENIGERDGCSMTIQQLCQLLQMVACKLQAKEVSLVVNPEP